MCVNHVNHVSHINQTKSYLLHLIQFFLHIFIIVHHPIILNISALATGWPGLCWNLTWQSLDAAFRSDLIFPRCQNFSFRTLAITLVAFLSQEQTREKTQSLFMWSQVCLTFLWLVVLKCCSLMTVQAINYCCSIKHISSKFGSWQAWCAVEVANLGG